MLRSKKPKPAGVCNVCHALTKHHEHLNHRCDHVVNGRRCYGTFKSAMTDLWDECGSCQGVGMVGSEVCSECAGFGWRLYG
jgi:hypothetical protein